MQIEYDLIIVLSNLMDKFGNLNNESKKRSKKAAEIYSLNPKSILITSGWAYRKDCKISIAEAFKNDLIKNYNVKKEKIICDKNSRDTVGDAIFTRLNITSNYISPKIAVITSPYHCSRAKEIFDFVYGKSAKVNFICCEESFLSNTTKKNKELESLKAFRKTFHGIKEGDTIKIYERLISKHPYYSKYTYEKLC